MGEGGFLTICYCSRKIGYCFPYCFLYIFVVGQGCDGGGQSRDRGIPLVRPVPPLGKTLNNLKVADCYETEMHRQADLKNFNQMFSHKSYHQESFSSNFVSTK